MNFAAIMAFVSAHPVSVFYACGIGGMLAHYTKKWGRGEYDGSIVNYLFHDQPKASLAAVMTYIGAATAIAATGTLHGMDVQTIAALGFTTGFTVDSAVNKT
jgi:hypothetical protein